MAQNEMRAMRGMPLRVPSMEGLAAKCLNIAHLLYLHTAQRELLGRCGRRLETGSAIELDGSVVVGNDPKTD